jgi:hypothetical protein
MRAPPNQRSSVAAVVGRRGAVAGVGGAVGRRGAVAGVGGTGRGGTGQGGWDWAGLGWAVLGGSRRDSAGLGGVEVGQLASARAFGAFRAIRQRLRLPSEARASAAGRRRNMGTAANSGGPQTAADGIQRRTAEVRKRRQMGYSDEPRRSANGGRWDTATNRGGGQPAADGIQRRTAEVGSRRQAGDPKWCWRREASDTPRRARGRREASDGQVGTQDGSGRRTPAHAAVTGRRARRREGSASGGRTKAAGVDT